MMILAWSSSWLDWRAGTGLAAAGGGSYRGWLLSRD